MFTDEQKEKMAELIAEANQMYPTKKVRKAWNYGRGAMLTIDDSDYMALPEDTWRMLVEAAEFPSTTLKLSHSEHPGLPVEYETVMHMPSGQFVEYMKSELGVSGVGVAWDVYDGDILVVMLTYDPDNNYWPDLLFYLPEKGEWWDEDTFYDRADYVGTWM